MNAEDNDEAAIKAEREAQLNARMEQIRKKNAELQRRYEEVKADKLNAETSSNEFNEKRRSAPIDEKPKVVERAPVKSRLGPIHAERHQQREPRTVPATIRKRTESEDGPPPDPKYSFLADSSRDNRDENDTDRPRQEDSRRHPSNYGGKDFDGVKTNLQRRKMQDKYAGRGPPRNKMEMSMAMTGRERREYEAWRRERNEIESERMNRQKTSSGQWRREWDKNKNMGLEEANAEPATQSRPRSNNFESDSYEAFQPPKQQMKNLSLKVRVDSGTSRRNVILSSEASQPKINLEEFNNPDTANKCHDGVDEGLEPVVDHSSEPVKRNSDENTEEVEHSSEEESWDDEGSWEEASEDEDKARGKAHIKTLPTDGSNALDE